MMWMLITGHHSELETGDMRGGFHLRDVVMVISWEWQDFYV